MSQGEEWVRVLRHRAAGGVDAHFARETEAVRLALARLDELEARRPELEPARLSDRQLAALTAVGHLLGRHSDLERDLRAAFGVEWSWPGGVPAGNESQMVLRPRPGAEAQPPAPPPESPIPAPPEVPPMPPAPPGDGGRGSTSATVIVQEEAPGDGQP